MEILILGILLVAAMVFVSTRIKRAAAEAYEPESVENDDFSIQKPEGFLHPLDTENEYAFEAYSKDYGDRSLRNIWRARARMRASEGLNVRKIIGDLENEETDVSEQKLDDLPPNQIGSIVRSYKEVDEVDYRVLRKILASKKKKTTWELKITILGPYEEQYTERACALMKGFELKEQ